MAGTPSVLFSALCLITIAFAVSSPEIVPEADFSILKDFEEAHDTLELVQDQASWTYCAKENHHCKFSGKARVKYGAKGKYAYKTETGGVRCSNGVFGDPKRGTPKKCYYQKVVKKKAVKKASDITKRDCKCRGHEMAVDAATSAFLDAMTAPADGTAQLVQEEASTELVTELVQAQAGLKGTTCEQWNSSSGKKWCTVSKSCKAATGVVNNVKIKGKCVPFCHSAGFKVPAKMKCATSDHVVAAALRRKKAAAKAKKEKATKAKVEKDNKKLEKDRKKAAENKAKAKAAAKKAKELKKKAAAAAAAKKKAAAEKAKKAAAKAAEKKKKAKAAEKKVKTDKAKKEKDAKASAGGCGQSSRNKSSISQSKSFTPNRDWDNKPANYGHALVLMRPSKDYGSYYGAGWKKMTNPKKPYGRWSDGGSDAFDNFGWFTITQGGVTKELPINGKAKTKYTGSVFGRTITSMWNNKNMFAINIGAGSGSYSIKWGGNYGSDSGSNWRTTQVGKFFIHENGGHVKGQKDPNVFNVAVQGGSTDALTEFRGKKRNDHAYYKTKATTGTQTIYVGWGYMTAANVGAYIAKDQA